MPTKSKEKDSASAFADCSVHIELFHLHDEQSPEYTSQIFFLWDILRSSSVDAILSQKDGFYGFAESCIVLYLIFLDSEPRSKRPKTDIEPEPEPESEPEPGRHLVGFVYLASPSSVAESTARECTVGVSVLPSARGIGIASYAVRYVLDLAFSRFSFHRVGARVLGPNPTFEPITGDNGKGKTKADEGIESSTTISERALRFFVGLGFSHEGTRRRAVPGDLALAATTDSDKSWRDAHELALLDTEWVYGQVRADARSNKIADFASESGVSTITEKQTGRKYPKKTRWDEMLARHQKEQETLASVERRLKRSASTETIKAGATMDFLMAAPGSLAPESSIGAGPYHSGGSDSSRSKAVLVETKSTEDESLDSIMSEDGFVDVHFRSFSLPPTGSIHPQDRIQEYLQNIDPSFFSTPSPSPSAPEIDAVVRPAIDTMPAEGVVSLATGHEDAGRELEDASSPNEEGRRHIDDVRDLNIPVANARDAAMPSQFTQEETSSGQMGVAIILPSMERHILETYRSVPEYEQDSEMSGTESDASAIHSEPDSGSSSDWERMSDSDSGSPPRSLASWTIASVSNAEEA